MNDTRQAMDHLQSLLTSSETPVSARTRMLGELRAQLPPELVDRVVLGHLERTQKLVAEAKAHQEELREASRALRAEPWTEATLIRAEAEHAIVQLGSSRLRVGVAPEVNVDRLQPGAIAFLGAERNVILDVAAPARAGESLLVLEELDGERVLVESGGRMLVLERAGHLRAKPLVRGDRILADSTSGLALEKLANDAGEDLFLSDPPETRFEDIGGNDEALDELRESLELHVEHPELARTYGEQALRAVLLVGKPGNGKTMIAAAIASWIARRCTQGRVRFMNVPPGALRSKWYGVTESNYRRIFRVARVESRRQDGSLVVIFFDEVDSIGLARGGPLAGIDDRTLLSFAAELDGLDPRGKVLVVAATNRLETLDPALLRPGRLGDCIFHVRQPDRAAARQILAKHLRPDLPLAFGHDEALDATIARVFSTRGEPLAVAQLRDGKRVSIRGADLISGARLANIARRAASRACRRAMGGGASGISHTDLTEAVDLELREATASLSPSNLRNFVDCVPRDADVVDIQRPRSAPAIDYELLALDRIELLAEARA